MEAVVESGGHGHQGSQVGKGVLSISLPCGARMEIGDAGQVALAAELLRMLR